MFAPKLETIWVRGCWGLKRIPATSNSCPMVDCEKEWWEKLEWDGHHPSLFKTLPLQALKEGSVIRLCIRFPGGSTKVVVYVLLLSSPCMHACSCCCSGLSA